jgi:cytochrome P450
MSSNAAVAPPQRVPLHRTLSGLLSNPLRTFDDIGRRSGGAIVQLDLGLSRPCVVARPEHLQHVLRDHATNYVREGMLWGPIRRLFGDGIGTEGPTWAHRRELLLPIFSAKNITTHLEELAAAIIEAVDRLDSYARTGQPIDTKFEMTRIIHRALVQVFFGDAISATDADRLGRAIDAAFTALGPRMLLPFVPESVPMPGDGAFRRANQVVDDVLFPLIRSIRQHGATGNDMISILCRGRDEHGRTLTDQQVRDDAVSMFAGASETSAVALTWLWVVLHTRPAIAAELYDEIDRVVGTGPPSPVHLASLPYTKMVLQELLRLHPVAWIIPRQANDDDVIDGVRIKAGTSVLASPYLAHRIAEHWEDPDTFDPQRFAPDRAQRRHRFAYLPFGGGPHQCLGSHFFTVEAQLIVATILSRYRPVVDGSSPVIARAAATLRPKRTVKVLLVPRRGIPPSPG